MKGFGGVAALLAVLLLVPIAAAATVVSVLAPTTTGPCLTGAPVVGPWTVPLQHGYRVTSAYGTRFHPILHTTKLHTGIDLVATRDPTVVAAASGTVTTAGHNRAYGNQVVVDHPDGIQTRYAHLSTTPTVDRGDQVNAGTPLGVQGATGYATGSHLHFEVIEHGTPIDPRPFMATAGAPLDGDWTGTSTQRPTGADPDACAPTGPGDLRVATWNVCLQFCGDTLRPWKSRVPGIAAHLTTTGAAVVALQETGRKSTHNRALVAALADTYDVAAYHRSKLLLFDKKRIANTTPEGTALPTAHFTVGGRGGVAAVLRVVATNQTFVVASVHPENGSTRAADEQRERYMRSALTVLDHLSDHGTHPVVIAGDLNSHMPGTGDQSRVARLLGQQHLTSAEQQTQNRQHDELASYLRDGRPRRGSRIDHVITNPAVLRATSWKLMVDADRRSTSLSDHLMVLADLAFTEQANSSGAPAGLG